MSPVDCAKAPEVTIALWTMNHTTTVRILLMVDMPVPSRSSVEAATRITAGRSLPNKPLYPATIERFRDVEIALGVDRNAVRRLELARPAAALTKARDDLERVAQQCVNLMG